MISLPLKYRPKEWEDLIGQDTIKTILTRQIETNNIKNAYIFAGKSGGGKTSCARLFGNKLNAEIIEVDAASNNGVDNIRTLTSTAMERSLSSIYKMIILDEAHMLTIQSWNALLKILEETPKYTIFILCTTDPQKIPQTILNRAQRYNFTKIDSQKILDRLKYVCEEEHFNYDINALDFISKMADGSMREALSLLNQAADFDTNIDVESVIKVLGVVDYKDFFNLTNSLLDGNEKEVINILYKIKDIIKDSSLLVNSYLSFCLDILKYILFKDISLTRLPSNVEEDIKSIINFENPEKYYNYLLDRLMELKLNIKNTSEIESMVEVSFLRISRCQ